jgi:hypothetical protein
MDSRDQKLYKFVIDKEHRCIVLEDGRHLGVFSFVYDIGYVIFCDYMDIPEDKRDPKDLKIHQRMIGLFQVLLSKVYFGAADFNGRSLCGITIRKYLDEPYNSEGI